MKIPEGFEPHFRKSRVTDPWEPIYSRRDADVVLLGLIVGEPHCNSRGFLHGGVIAALADNAMGLSFVATAGRSAPHTDAKLSAITVGLSIDYVATAKLGQWLQILPRVIRAGRSLGFVDALISADDKSIARANGTFQLLTFATG